MTDEIWTMELGDGPFVATAIHDGHTLRDDLLKHVVLPESERLREEDPFTNMWTAIAPTRIIGTRSRFEVDLNRPREKAVYRTPDDAWGLEVWQGDLPEDMVTQSLAEYDLFYETLAKLFGNMAERHGRFLIFDLHTYNYRRGGPGQPPANAEENPQVNVGTGTMLDRSRWAHVIECFMEELGACEFPTGGLDVRENVKFSGGQFARWTHARFPQAACVLSVEFKKFFMDEWTGKPDRSLVEGIEKALKTTVPHVLRALESTP